MATTEVPPSKPQAREDADIIAVLDSLTVSDMRVMLWFFSGFSPEAFQAALALTNGGVTP